ncbi:MAG: hypothetical protein AAF933_16375 [Pseudomonadota bacterium]
MTEPTTINHPDRAYARAARRFSMSFMSDAKWRKLFAALIAARCELECAEWWWINSPTPCVKRFPREHEVLEKRFADGYFQPTEYRWIERIRIPRFWRPYKGVGLERQQDLEAVSAVMTAAGAFQLEWETGGAALTLYAYKH